MQVDCPYSKAVTDQEDASAVSCVACGAGVAESDANYSEAGLKCRECSLKDQIAGHMEDSRQPKKASKGLLDELFLGRLTKTGKRAYWIGQLVLLPSWLAYVMLTQGGFHAFVHGSSRLLIIGGAVGAVIGWGIACSLLWRKPKAF